MWRQTCIMELWLSQPSLQCLGPYHYEAIVVVTAGQKVVENVFVIVVVIIISHLYFFLNLDLWYHPCMLPWGFGAYTSKIPGPSAIVATVYPLL